VTSNQATQIENILNTVGSSLNTIYSNFLGGAGGGRSQLQLGVLYKKDSLTTVHTFSDIENNLKIKHSPVKQSTNPLYFLSEFEVGSNSTTPGTNQADSAFRFKSDFLETINGNPVNTKINVYSGGAGVISNIAGGTAATIFDKTSGILIKKEIGSSNFNAVIGISNPIVNGAPEGNFSILTTENLNIASAKTLTIRSFSGTDTNSAKSVFFEKFGSGDQTTAIGIGGKPNASLTIYGSKEQNTANVNDTRWDSDQVNIGVMAGAVLSSDFYSRAANAASPIAKEISSYIGLNLYHDPQSPQLYVKHRSDPSNAASAAAPGVGGAFIMTRDGSMHYISVADDSLVIQNILQFSI
jgi:hypothetical protein